jgi:hypothetical protein
MIAGGFREEIIIIMNNYPFKLFIICFFYCSGILYTCREVCGVVSDCEKLVGVTRKTEYVLIS